MIFKLKYNSHNRIEIIKFPDSFFLIPNSFHYKKREPAAKKSYKRVIQIDFIWFIWTFYLLLKKPR